jgi:signal transduction histidine kinase
MVLWRSGVGPGRFSDTLWLGGYVTRDKLGGGNDELGAPFCAIPDVLLVVAADGTLLDHRGGVDDDPLCRSRPCAGQSLEEALPPEPARWLRLGVDQVLADSGAIRVAYTFEGRFYEARCYPLAGDQVAVAVRDVSDRNEAASLQAKQAEQAARNEALSQFAYVASHDLRAPLRAILSLTDWLVDDIGDAVSPESQEHLRLLSARVNRMDTLLESLLEYSRVGRVGVTVETVDVGELVTGVADLLAKPGFTVSIRGELPTLDTARGPLERVFLNLIANAIKHHDLEQGHIEIGCTQAGSAYRFVVCDDGPGIPADQRDKAFAMFSTLKRRDEIEGSGMGLALIRRIVETAGGDITLSDAPHGRGAQFSFSWPVRWA